MARYGVNVPGSAIGPEPVRTVAVESSEAAAPQPVTGKQRSAHLVTAYAFAVAITPEFTFLGIPKVRITDLILPFMFLSYMSAVRPGSSSQKGSIIKSLCIQILLWNLGALLIWGEAPLNPGIFYISKRAIYFLVAVLAGSCVRSIKSWNQVVRTLVFASPILNYTVLRELVSNQASGGVLNTSEGMRASGIIAQQQTSTALFIVIVCSLTLGAWDSYKDAVWRLGTVVALTSGVAAIMATGSRGGLACIVFSVIFTILLRPGKIVTYGIVAGCVGMLCWGFTPDALKARFASLLPETQATFSGVMVDDKYMPEQGSSSVADRVANVNYFFAQYLPKCALMGLGAGYRRLGALDNCYLSEWLYHGLIGLLLLCALLAALLKYCAQAARQAEDSVEKGVATGVGIAIAVMCISGFQGDTFYLIRPMECLALLVGMVAARKALRGT